MVPLTNQEQTVPSGLQRSSRTEPGSGIDIIPEAQVESAPKWAWMTVMSSQPFVSTTKMSNRSVRCGANTMDEEVHSIVAYRSNTCGEAKRHARFHEAPASGIRRDHLESDGASIWVHAVVHSGRDHPTHALALKELMLDGNELPLRQEAHRGSRSTHRKSLGPRPELGRRMRPTLNIVDVDRDIGSTLDRSTSAIDVGMRPTTSGADPSARERFRRSVDGVTRWNHSQGPASTRLCHRIPQDRPESALSHCVLVNPWTCCSRWHHHHHRDVRCEDGTRDPR